MVVEASFFCRINKNYNNRCIDSHVGVFSYTSQKKHYLRPIVDSIIICSNLRNCKLLALSRKNKTSAVAVFESGIYTKGVQFLKCLMYQLLVYTFQ